MLLLSLLYFSCKDNLNFPICQTNSCFFSFPHKNRVGGQAPPHAKQAPHFQKLSFITQSAAQPPGQALKWTPQASGLAPKYSRLRLYFGA